MIFDDPSAPTILGGLGCTLDQGSGTAVQAMTNIGSNRPDPIDPGGIATAFGQIAASNPVAFEIFGFGVTQTEVVLASTLLGALAVGIYRFRTRHDKHRSSSSENE